MNMRDDMFLMKTVCTHMLTSIYFCISRYVKPNRSFNDRAMIIGCFADIAHATGAAILPYLEKMYSIIAANISDKDYNIRRNSCFALGRLCEACPEQLRPHFPTILSSLHPHFQQRPKEDRGVVDNAAGAVARMIRADQGTSLPLNIVLPVWLNSLPVQCDFQEAESTFESLIYLVQLQPPALSQFMPLVMSIIARSLVLGEIDEEIRVTLCNLCKSMHASNSSGFQLLVNGLIPSERDIIIKAVSP
jgi:hypothetical protein